MWPREGAFTVPTMAVIIALLEEGDKLGLPAVSMEKLRRVVGFSVVEPGDHETGGREDGVRDRATCWVLLHVRQCNGVHAAGEGVARRSTCCGRACAVNAELLPKRRGGWGAFGQGQSRACWWWMAILLKIFLLLGSGGGPGVPIIMKDGRFHKRTI